MVEPGRLNSGPDHISRIESGYEPVNLDDSLPNVQLFVISMFANQCIDIIQFFSMGYALAEFTTMQKKQLVVRVAYFQLITGELYKIGPNEILCH